MSRITPVRCHDMGLPDEAICALYSLSQERLDAMLDEAAARRRNVPAPAGKQMMTPLLKRDDLDRWETRRAERL